MCNSAYYFPTFIVLVLIGLTLVSSTVVETKYGKIEGTFDGKTRAGRPFYQFRGMQYAVVPERFKPSVPTEPWKDIKSAKEFGSTCSKSEQCLFLNVYTTSLPHPKNGTLLPVAVYLHGGSFKYNTGNYYGPNYLLDEDIIFVTINYRLGILGFLSTEDEASPGNYGLKDQVNAFRWIQENIYAFGGDKNKVTIMGQSAGGTSVSLHLISPMSQGLFHNAIAQSGTFLSPALFTVKPLRYAKKLAKYLGCKNSEDTHAIVACLKNIPLDIIGDPEMTANATVKFLEEPLAAFGPVIEPVLGNGSNIFLGENPLTILKSGRFQKVPLMSGVVKEEGIYLWAAGLLFYQQGFIVDARQRLQANFSGLAPYAFYFDEKAPANRLTEIANQVEQFYFGKLGGFSLKNNQTLYQLAHLYSDRLFVDSGIKFMNLYAKHAPTYPYLYTYNKYVGIEFGEAELHKKYHLDATHAAELDMIISPLFDQVRNETDFQEVSKSVAKLWASFIITGVPNATYGSERKFPAIDANMGLEKWYRLDTDTELMNNSLFSERISFWKSMTALGLNDDDFEQCNC